MSFLAPWYLAAALAVAAPVLFHLIRRTPKGRQAFGSLMFLTPSPPKFTRRSQLDEWLLLALRSLAIILLALAFARPFLREASQLDLSDVAGRQVTVLIDGSASMRRGDLWTQAKASAVRLAREASPGDVMAFAVFDRQSRTLVRFEDWKQAAPGQRSALVQAALDKTPPSWMATDLGAALAAAAESLQAAEDEKDAEAALGRQIIVISDMQSGAALEALQTYQWPQDVLVEALPLSPRGESNAGLHLAAEITESEFEEPSAKTAPVQRLRVINDAASKKDSFRLAWTPRQQAAAPASAARRSANPAAAARPVYVPPGQSRVVEVPLQDANGGAWTLVGDDHPFDNSLHLAPQQAAEVKVVYLGPGEAEDAQAMPYYLSRAFTETPRRRVEVVLQQPEQPLSLEEPDRPRLVVLAQAPSEENLSRLERFIEQGGVVLAVASDTSLEAALARLSGQTTLQVREAETVDYDLFGQVDFSHPLFVPFASPRHSDFTKIRFWRRIRIEVPDAPSGMQTLARFDKGDPALIEFPRGRGRLMTLATTWRPADSQLALSTKFVPLVGRLLELAGGAEAPPPQYLAGDRVPIPSLLASADSLVVHTPDRQTVRLMSGAESFANTTLPGLYRLEGAGQSHWFAVNVPPSESRTAALEAEELARWGVRLGKVQTQTEELARRRQRRDIELERRQQLWRWLLAAALGVLIVETVVASVRGRRTAPSGQPHEASESASPPEAVSRM